VFLVKRVIATFLSFAAERGFKKRHVKKYLSQIHALEALMAKTKDKD
jgi:hypothetical protein